MITVILFYISVTRRDLGSVQCGIVTVCAGVAAEASVVALPNLSAVHLLLFSIHRCLNVP